MPDEAGQNRSPPGGILPWQNGRKEKHIHRKNETQDRFGGWPLSLQQAVGYRGTGLRQYLQHSRPEPVFLTGQSQGEQPMADVLPSP